MKSPIILEGKSFVWKDTVPVDERGNVHWGVAMCADPGVMQCPHCGEYLWREGDLVECPTCHESWRPE